MTGLSGNILITGGSGTDTVTGDLIDSITGAESKDLV